MRARRAPRCASSGEWPRATRSLAVGRGGIAVPVPGAAPCGFGRRAGTASSICCLLRHGQDEADRFAQPLPTRRFRIELGGSPFESADRTWLHARCPSSSSRQPKRRDSPVDAEPDRVTPRAPVRRRVTPVPDAGRWRNRGEGNRDCFENEQVQCPLRKIGLCRCHTPAASMDSRIVTESIEAQGVALYPPGRAGFRQTRQGTVRPSATGITGWRRTPVSDLRTATKSSQLMQPNRCASLAARRFRPSSPSSAVACKMKSRL